jgi:hypothetical protein
MNKHMADDQLIYLIDSQTLLLIQLSQFNTVSKQKIVPNEVTPNPQNPPNYRSRHNNYSGTATCMPVSHSFPAAVQPRKSVWLSKMR